MDSKTTKNIILSCAVIGLITCVCVGLIMVSGVGVSLAWPFNFNTEPGASPIITVEPNISDADDVGQPDPINTDHSAPGDVTPLPDDIAETVAEIETQVSEIRGLKLTNPVPRILVNAEELEEMVVNEFFADYSDEDARQDVLVLSLLGLVPTDFDLRNFYLDLYSEQIAGFYDSETEEIYIVSGVTFGGSEKMTYAHEYTHVLQDQTYRFDEGLNYNQEACEVDSERCAAIQALIEGDASFTEILWFQTFATRQDYQDVMRAFEEFSSPVFDNAPPFIQLDLYFPYEKGYAFVEYLYNDGGYDAIDAAFLNPPVSTEQIIHPERYPWDQPVEVSLPDLTDVLGGDWVLFDQNVMGEWFTYLILSQAYDETYRIDEAQAEQAAAGWGGDAYAFYLNETTDEVLFVLDLVWDTLIDADEFMIALANYANLRWDGAAQPVFGQPTWTGPEGTVFLTQDRERTLWVIAPTRELAESVFNQLQ